MTDKKKDFIFVQIENILKQYLPHGYSEPQYINDIATEITDWISEYEDKNEK